MALAKGVGTQKRALRCGEDEFLKMFTRLSEITARFVLFSFFFVWFYFSNCWLCFTVDYIVSTDRIDSTFTSLNNQLAVEF